MQMPQKGAQTEDNEYEAMTSLGHHNIHELLSSSCDKATPKKLGLLLQLLPSEIEVSHSDAKSGPKHKKKLAAHEMGTEKTETPAGTSSRLFPKALASELEAAGTRGPESSAAGVSAAKRVRKVGAAAECDEGEEAELDAYDQAEAEAKRARKVGAAAEKDGGDDAELDAYDQAEAEAEAEAAALDEALDAVDPISAKAHDVRAQAALATFDEVGRVYAALLKAGLTVLYITYTRRVNGADAAEALAIGRTGWTQWAIDSYTMDAEFAHLLFNLRTPVARAVEIVGLKRAVISRNNEEGADGWFQLGLTARSHASTLAGHVGWGVAILSDQGLKRASTVDTEALRLLILEPACHASKGSSAGTRVAAGGQLELAVARQAREADNVSKYAPSELEAEDVGVPHVIDLVLDEVVVDEALAAKRALASPCAGKEATECSKAVVADIACRRLQAWSKPKLAATAEAAEGSVVKQGVQRAHERIAVAVGLASTLVFPDAV
ncbi:hypothetical protein T492DRAFT_878970 [Pavlovales sp. CCMP2436]|nr:hypothetical protein T492DRAFT_878970 [Pavlovales sp. CCMP2436]